MTRQPVPVFSISKTMPIGAPSSQIGCVLSLIPVVLPFVFLTHLPIYGIGMAGRHHVNTETSMKDGLYSATFSTPKGNGTGVVVLQDGKLRGGDSMMAYVGTYSESDNQFSAQFEVKVHSRPPGMSSVFGRDHVHVSANGTSDGDTVQMNATAKEVPGVALRATLKRVAD